MEGFDRVFDLINGHGWYQYRLLLILGWQKIFLTLNHIGFFFLGNIPDHFCYIEELQNSNWTLEQIKAISIPLVNLGANNTGEIQYEKCEYYNLDYASILETSSSFEEAYSKIDFGSLTTSRCSQWNYDQSIYKSTVATDFNLVCDNRWKAATIQAGYMAGGIIGSIMFGSLSDRFLGRRRTILVALCVAVTSTILAGLVKSYWAFLFFRVMIAIGANGSMQNCFVLMTEHADKKYRALLGMLELLPFAFGYMLLPGLAYLFREWWKLQLSFGLISTSLVVYYWVLPDSIRWLATHGHTNEAMKNIYKIAEVNKYPKPNHEDLLEIVKQCHEEHASELRAHRQNSEGHGRAERKSFCEKIKKWCISLARNFGRLMETSEIRKRSIVFWVLFLIVAMVYYGLVFNATLSDNPFLLVFLGGLMEVPAYIVVVPFISKLGRKPTTVATFFLTGACMLAIWKIPTEYNLIRLTLAMCGKLFTTSGFSIIYLLGAELYPTELRTTGIAVGFFAGRIGAISSPYMLDLLQVIYKDLPTAIFGMIALLGGLISFLLPETKTLGMTDNVTEIEMQAEVEKAKAKERRQSLIESRRQSLAGGGSRKPSLVDPLSSIPNDKE